MMCFFHLLFLGRRMGYPPSLSRETRPRDESGEPLDYP